MRQTLSSRQISAGEPALVNTVKQPQRVAEFFRWIKRMATVFRHGRNEPHFLGFLVLLSLSLPSSGCVMFPTAVLHQEKEPD